MISNNHAKVDWKKNFKKPLTFAWGVGGSLRAKVPPLSRTIFGKLHKKNPPFREDLS